MTAVPTGPRQEEMEAEYGSSVRLAVRFKYVMNGDAKLRRVRAHRSVAPRVRKRGVLTISMNLAMVHSSLVCDILCQTCMERMKLRFAVVLWKG